MPRCLSGLQELDAILGFMRLPGLAENAEGVAFCLAPLAWSFLWVQRVGEEAW